MTTPHGPPLYGPSRPHAPYADAVKGRPSPPVLGRNTSTTSSQRSMPPPLMSINTEHWNHHSLRDGMSPRIPKHRDGCSFLPPLYPGYISERPPPFNYYMHFPPPGPTYPQPFSPFGYPHSASPAHFHSTSSPPHPNSFYGGQYPPYHPGYPMITPPFSNTS